MYPSSSPSILLLQVRCLMDYGDLILTDGSKVTLKKGLQVIVRTHPSPSLLPLTQPTLFSPLLEKRVSIDSCSTLIRCYCTHLPLLTVLSLRSFIPFSSPSLHSSPSTIYSLPTLPLYLHHVSPLPLPSTEVTATVQYPDILVFTASFAPAGL